VLLNWFSTCHNNQTLWFCNYAIFNYQSLVSHPYSKCSDPPEMLGPLTSDVAVQGADFRIQCPGRGFPHVEYMWFKVGLLLFNITTTSINLLNNFMLLPLILARMLLLISINRSGNWIWKHGSNFYTFVHIRYDLNFNTNYGMTWISTRIYWAEQLGNAVSWHCYS